MDWFLYDTDLRHERSNALVDVLTRIYKKFSKRQFLMRPLDDRLLYEYATLLSIFFFSRYR